MPNEAAGAGWIYDQLQIPVVLPAGTGQANVLLSLPSRYRRSIVALDVSCTVAYTGAGASRVLNLRRGNATGTIIASRTLALADGAAVGQNVAGALVAGVTPDLIDSDTLTLEFAAGGTAFTAGQAIIIVTTRARMQQRN